LELLLMLVLRAAEQLDQDAVMQIDQLIDHGRGGGRPPPGPGAPPPQPPAGTQRDAEGRWQFSFTLTGARADAD
ncbi:hypothetical protein PT243_17010, partial [Klebsiella pneumoniae]|nr:hypothetical protein [Klebsiella pneumoniae]